MTGAPRILIAETEPAIRALLRTVLASAGFETVEAADGVEAQQHIRAQPPDLLLLDLEMPRKEGRDILAEIRADAATHSLPVILISSEATAIPALDARADDYLAKPLDSAEVVARVRALLRTHRRWPAGGERVRAERERRIGFLRSLRRGPNAEQAPYTLVRHIRSAEGVLGAAILRFRADGAGILVASEGDAPASWRPGSPLPPDQSAALLDRARSGPWIEATGEEPEPRAFVYVPLAPEPPVRGILAVAVSGDTHAAGLLLADLLDCAEIASALLADLLLEQTEGNTRRAQLRQLLFERRFLITFQPIFDLVRMEIVGYEALTKFHDGGNPASRFAEAARWNMSVEFERGILAASLLDAAALPAGAWLSVNVSPSMVLEGVLPELADGAPRPLVFELTEHAAVRDYEALRRSLAPVRARARVAVDDAGAGFASLRHILELAPDFVKLDISIVRDVDRDPARQALVAGLMHFSEKTPCAVIAEGIETNEELETLRSLGVSIGQGYLLGRPEPIATGGRR
jgi:EAL domain-containing protein (putative c-di-GMP-specific phosphodiesterase class I)/CheY-like chemotaxis protein